MLKFGAPFMMTLADGRSVPRNHLPINWPACASLEPAARLPSGAARVAPPVQLALAGSPSTTLSLICWR